MKVFFGNYLYVYSRFNLEAYQTLVLIFNFLKDQVLVVGLKHTDVKVVQKRRIGISQQNLSYILFKFEFGKI